MTRPIHFFPALCLLGLALGACSKKAEPTVSGTSSPAPTPFLSARPPLSPAAPKAVEPAAGTPYEAWFAKYHLDLNDPKMLDADPDGDGYTNREEFMAGTDPLDSTSHPSTQEMMRLKEYKAVEVPFVLRSVEGESVQIERSDEGEKKMETLKPGQSLRNSPYRVTHVQSGQGQDKDGNPIDTTQVTLEHSTTHEKVNLVKGLPTRSVASYAVLTSPDGKQTITVHQGDTFSWPSNPSVAYTVRDLRSEQVILQQLDTQQMWTVRKP